MECFRTQSLIFLTTVAFLPCLKADSDIDRSIVLSIAACYLVRLDDENRKKYLSHIDLVLKKVIHAPVDSGAAYLQDQFEL